MSLLLLSASTAFALQAFSCDGVDVVDTVPSAGATGVPVDARLALVFGPGTSCLFGDETATLTDADGNVVPTYFGEDSPNRTWLLEIFPDFEGLLPDTSYVLTASPTEGEVVEIGFTTGSGTVAGVTEMPTMTIGEARWNAKDTRATFEVEITPAPDPDGLSVVQVKDADDEYRAIRSFRVNGDEPITATLSWENSVRKSEVCPQVRQVDGRGVATKWAGPPCAEVTGCSSGGGAPALALVLLGALGAIGRRRE